MKVYVLAKNHRALRAYCIACGGYKVRTARLVIDNEKDRPVEVSICSGCSAALHEAAVQGRKVQ